MKHISQYTKQVIKNIADQEPAKMTPKQKREYWEKIKSEIPELADFCIELDKKMGKPESVFVDKWPDKRINNE